MNKFLHSLLIFSLLTPSYLPAMEPSHMELPVPTEKLKKDDDEITPVLDEVTFNSSRRAGLARPEPRRTAEISQQVRFSDTTSVREIPARTSSPASKKDVDSYKADSETTTQSQTRHASQAPVFYQEEDGHMRLQRSQSTPPEASFCVFMLIMVTIVLVGTYAIFSQPDQTTEVTRLAVPIQQCQTQAITQFIGSVPSELQTLLSLYSTRFQTFLENLARTTPNRVEFARRSAEYINGEMTAFSHLYNLNVTTEIIEHVRTFFTNCTQTWLYPNAVPHQTSAAVVCAVTLGKLIEFFMAMLATYAIVYGLA